ncbi:MAG: polyphosphate polymerase domain-containing protein [Clostridiales bacterium]|nr:polyphosphate polymerase domain-containing protein [Clostridiales bacterium]
MNASQLVFERYEKKYLLNSRQYEAFRKEADKHFHMGEYGRSGIYNIYYDTPDFLLIRRSINGGVYKEKLRLRAYSVPEDGSPAFVELKKKYKGIVYKRRIEMNYGEAFEYLGSSEHISGENQIASELDYFFDFYKYLEPQMVISYDRIALTGNDDPNLRITFDNNILWRTDSLDLRKGVFGEQLLADGMVLMEVKIPEAMPLWMAETISRLEIYPTSFSKYGMAYKQLISDTQCLARA